MTIKKLKFNLGHALAKTGNISTDQLNIALTESQKTGKRVKDILVDFGYIKESDLAKAISTKMNLPAFSLRGIIVNPKVKKLVPAELARRCLTIPVFLSGNTLAVATDDPFDFNSLSKIADYTQKDIYTAFTSSDDIKAALQKYDDSIQSF